MIKEHNLTLDISKLSTLNTNIKIKRRDYGTHAFSFTIADGGQEITDLSPYKFRIRFLRKDKTTTESIELDTPYYVIRSCDVEIAGDTFAEVSLYKDSTRITTCTFKFKVIADIDSDEGIAKDDRYPILEKLFDLAGELAKKIFIHKTEPVLDHPDLSVTIDKLADSAVITQKIANGAVTEEKIKDEAVTEGKVADGAITTEKIADNAVSLYKLADSAVITQKIANGAVTYSKIDNGAVINPKIANGAVTSSKLADNAVITQKIANGAVTEEKIADGAVTEEKIEDEAITEEKIADGAITEEKFADSVLIYRGELPLSGDTVFTKDSIAEIKDGVHYLNYTRLWLIGLPETFVWGHLTKLTNAGMVYLKFEDRNGLKAYCSFNANDTNEFKRQDWYIHNIVTYRGYLEDIGISPYTFEDIANLKDGIYSIGFDEKAYIALPEGYTQGYLHKRYVPSKGIIYLKYEDFNGLSATVHCSPAEEGSINESRWTVDQMQGHIEDSSIHVTQEEKSNWNGKAENSDFLNHKQDLTAHTYTGEKEYWNRAIHQEELPPPNNDVYTYGELGGLSDDFYVVTHDKANALNLPYSAGVLNKIAAAGIVIFRYMDLEGNIYHADYTEKEQYPFLQVEQNWWQKINPKDYSAGGEIEQKFNDLSGEIAQAGKSSYLAAVKHGFTGTEEEFNKALADVPNFGEPVLFEDKQIYPLVTFDFIDGDFIPNENGNGDYIFTTNLNGDIFIRKISSREFITIEESDYEQQYQEGSIVKNQVYVVVPDGTIEGDE